ncbi:PREDICTED: uncharacterized protein LOC105970540 [Erythranthe guttata]|uniref:uncharacterized protein LOC105970540 n=1 Tax=Erythranthe guttata TaxID=4155 RepID=UPI00064E0237|nr:PREDICTED: uncharacterized protein LOC105970540 [Erythranthe guttata]|eukprot:XP_012850829.1 PREDICTED: uncharacterized protein LOC105970540 [Erythranthe guttata]
MNQSAHIDKVLQRQSSEEVLNNRLRLKTSIDCVRWLAYQSCSFRGHNEGPTSKSSGVLQERFLDIVSVKDTTSLTLKNELSTFFSHHALSIDNLRGQGYDGASNMRGEWNMLQALFLKDCPLKKMFSATGSVLQTIISDGANYSQRGDADSAYTAMTSFQFVFILLLMERIMGVTDVLCHALQQRSQDILNAMHLVSTTKQLLQNLRDDGWDSFLNDLNLFCQSNKVGREKSIHQPRDTNITMEHHFHFDILVNTIDTQMKELNCRFNEQTMELLTLSCALDPSDSFKSFKVDDICTLVDKYYPADFTKQDKLLLKFQLQHYHLDMTKHQDLYHLSTLAALCEGLTKTEKSKVYYLVDRLIYLILLLPVSTATTERAFSVMKLTKTRILNKIKDGFFGDCMILHIEREIADLFSRYSIIDEFYSKKKRRAQLK